jgi:hypothetical protein
VIQEGRRREETYQRGTECDTYEKQVGFHKAQRPKQALALAIGGVFAAIFGVDFPA